MQVSSAQSEVLHLINDSRVPQSVIDTSLPNAPRYELQPFTSQPFPRRIGELFLSKCSHAVRRYSPVKLPGGDPDDPTVYIANMTGNPFLPATIKVQRVHKGEHISVEVENPLRKATVVRHEMSRGQKIGQNPKDPGEMTFSNQPKIPVVIPAGVRLPASRGVAEWILLRDARQEERHMGKIIEARAPGAFEPNETWPLQDLLLYAATLDSSSAMAAEIGKVPREHEYKDRPDLEREARVKFFYNVLVYRLYDMEYPLVTQDEFVALLRIRDEKQAAVLAARNSNITDKQKEIVGRK